MNIPKFIHQIWWDFSGKNRKISEYNLEWEKNRQKIEKKYTNNGWKYKLWSHKEVQHLVRKTFPEQYKVWKQLSNIEKHDIARCIILYNYGGLYCDLDMIYNKLFIMEKYSSNVKIILRNTTTTKISITNDIIISCPKHPFWVRYINSIEPPSLFNFIKPKIIQTFQTTGPKKIQKLYEETLFKKEIKIDSTLTNKYFINFFVRG